MDPRCVLVLLLGESVPPSTRSSFAASCRAPNLLVIRTDQQRHDALGRFQADYGFVPDGPGRIRNPNLDNLSRDGAYFPVAYAHCAVCALSHTSLLTGRSIEATGVRTNWASKAANYAGKPGNDASDKVSEPRSFPPVESRGMHDISPSRACMD